MTGNVNKKITDKIEQSDLNSTIKEFLGEILFYELEHFEEARPRYTDEYQRFIEKYSKGFRVKKE